MDPSIARRTFRTLEPVHGLVYFAPEAAPAYAEVGADGAAGYFASRSAALGPVPAEVVVATFFNFEPGFVRASLGDVWGRADPTTVLATRDRVAVEALRRIGGETVVDGAVAEAADLAGRAAEVACSHPEGRPLFAAHAALGWGDEADPLLALWRAQTLLREFRGDGHIAALVAAGIDGCEALVLHAGTGEVPRSALQGTRMWSDEAWAEATARLATRGWVDADGDLTAAGAAARAEVEDRTDRSAVAAYAVLGEEGCARLRALVRPLSRAIVGAGAFGFGDG